MDELAEIAVTAHNKQGEHDKAVEAALLIRSVPRRMAKLQMHGYWKPLADLTQVLHYFLPQLATHGLPCCIAGCRLFALGSMAAQHLCISVMCINAAMSACCLVCFQRLFEQVAAMTHCSYWYAQAVWGTCLQT